MEISHTHDADVRIGVRSAEQDRGARLGFAIFSHKKSHHTQGADDECVQTWTLDRQQ